MTLKMCNTKDIRMSRNLQATEKVFDQATLANTEFWKTLITTFAEFRKAAILIVTPKQTKKDREFQNYTASYRVSERRDFREKLVNKRVMLCWDDGEWYT